MKVALNFSFICYKQHSPLVHHLQLCSAVPLCDMLMLLGNQMTLLGNHRDYQHQSPRIAPGQNGLLSAVAVVGY